MKIEVSIGEVVDKITILQIKKNNIKDEKKLSYINQELNILVSSLKHEGANVPIEMIDELRDVNQKLWDTEDVIRLCEKQDNFGEDFVKHARLDAILNDERFLIKNKINNHCNSLVKEQKSYEGLYTAD
jgi:translation elongation factor EF-Tu-like GTPase